MQTTEVAQKKSIIRESFLKRRQSVIEENFETFFEKEKSLVAFLFQLISSIKGQQNSELSIGAYRHLKGEVSLEEFCTSLSSLSSFPKVTETGLCFYKVKPEALSTNNLENLKYWSKSKLGIFEPLANNKDQPVTPEVLLIPGLAFDKEFMRLGFGSGFYDKFLKNYSGIKIGISFCEAISEDSLPCEDHDIAMDFIVTDKYILQNINKKNIKG